MHEAVSCSLIEVDPGRCIHALLEGPENAPVLVFDAGAFGIYADGWWLKEALKDRFRVILYDRAGMGNSDPVPPLEVPSPKWHAQDIEKLLAALSITEKVILIGHSMSGVRLHTMANLYPDRLNGLVFVDAVSPRRLKETMGKFLADQFGLMLKIGAFGAEQGWAAPFVKVAPNNFKLSGPMRADKLSSYASGRHHAASRDEVLSVDYAADYLHGDGVFDFPLAIFASTWINGMREEDAERAHAQSGFGYYRAYKGEDHVSILTDECARAVARVVDEMSSFVSDR